MKTVKNLVRLVFVLMYALSLEAGLVFLLNRSTGGLESVCETICMEIN